MKKITGDEDFRTPICFLVVFSMLFVTESVEIVKNIDAHGSIMLSEPILFTNNIFKTIIRFCWFSIAVILLLTAVKEEAIILKFTYSLGSLPFILIPPVINKTGFKSLYAIKFIIISIVIMTLMRYLINTTELYKKALKDKEQTNNKSAAPDGSQVRRP